MEYGVWSTEYGAGKVNEEEKTKCGSSHDVC